MVVLYHYFFIGPLQGFWPRRYFADWLFIGDFGVDIFFVISGFVISISTEGRTPLQFLRARFLRIYPTFLICSGTTLLMSATLPGIRAHTLFPNWFATLTFAPTLFGGTLSSAVYWTIVAEVTFYLIVFILMLTNAWRRNLGVICASWLALSYFNIYVAKSSLISHLFLTDFSGHFVIGILLYLRLRSTAPSSLYLLGILAGNLIARHVIMIEDWFSGGFGQSYSHESPYVITLLLIFTTYWCAQLSNTKIPLKFAYIVGGLSYPIYLFNADLGFWSHAIVERTSLSRSTLFNSEAGYPMIYLFAIAGTISLSYLVYRFLEPPVRWFFSRVWDTVFHRA